MIPTLFTCSNVGYNTYPNSNRRKWICYISNRYGALLLVSRKRFHTYKASKTYTIYDDTLCKCRSIFGRFYSDYSLDKTFHLGATYRTDNSLAGLVKFNVASNWFLGYAYEYSLRSELLGRANGSNEFYLQYKF